MTTDEELAVIRARREEARATLFRLLMLIDSCNSRIDTLLDRKVACAPRHGSSG